VSQLNTRIDDDGCFVASIRTVTGAEFRAADPNAVIALMKLAMAMADARAGDVCPDPSKHPIAIDEQGAVRLLADDEVPG
jgi:hypothetical protein